MALTVQQRRKSWDARIKRIQTGRTRTQSARAEGTVPMQLQKRSQRRKPGIRGLMAWMLGGGLAWMIATVVSVASPATLLVERHDFKQAAEYVQSLGDPILAALCFLLGMSFMRILGVIPKLLGFVIMAWVFALQAGLDVPTVAQLVEIGETALGGREAMTSAVDALRDWALQQPA